MPDIRISNNLQCMIGMLASEGEEEEEEEEEEATRGEKGRLDR